MKKTIHIILIAILLIGCDDDKEIQPTIDNPITFDGIDALCGVLPSGFYEDIDFVSDSIAYIVSNKGKIFKTKDGGTTWEEQNSGTELPLYDIFFLDDLNGYVTGFHGTTNEGIILKTTDGGNTWTQQNFQTQVNSIHFVDKMTGFATGQKLLKTMDGGETWNEFDLDFFAYGDINFFDGQTGFLNAIAKSNSEFQSVLLKTVDGGENWSPLSTNASGKIQILSEIALLHSQSKTYITHDKGNSWNQLNNVPGMSVHFINEYQAIAVGQYWYELGFYPYGAMYITNDGGSSWEQKLMSNKQFLAIYDIDFINDSTALAVGHSPTGCILKLRF